MKYRENRRITDFPATIEWDDGCSPVEVRDLSRNGLKVLGLFDVEEGDKVTLCIRQKRLPCQVRWSGRDMVGLRLLQPLPSELQSLVGRAPGAYAGRYR